MDDFKPGEPRIVLQRKSSKILKNGWESTDLYLPAIEKTKMKVFCLTNQLSLGTLYLALWEYTKVTENEDFLLYLAENYR